MDAQAREKLCDVLVELAHKARSNGMRSLENDPRAPEIFDAANKAVNRAIDEDEDKGEEALLSLRALVLFEEGNHPDVIREILHRRWDGTRCWGDVLLDEVRGA